MRAMARLLIGILVGAALAAAGGWLWSQREACLGRCGDGTRCQEHRCIAAVTPPPTAPPKERHRRARHSSTSGGDSATAPEIHLKPGDDKMIAEGDALGRPERIDLSDNSEAKELSQEELDSTFHPASPRIEKCITDALGDAPLETGRVEVGFRVEKSGAVSRVRVEAPALLQHQGLTRCVRGAVTSLHFSSSGGASVVTYPFELK
jgi:hypothetical protein